MAVLNLRAMIEDGGTVVNGWVSADSPYVAEVLSRSGLDAVTVDAQHGMFGLDGAIALLQGVSAGPAVPMARCPALDPASIGKLLDAGAFGIICPAIDTVDDARALVAACRYPPVGERSFGPARGLMLGGPGYVRDSTETVLVWAMIESATALDNLEAIVAVPGLDGVYVGPNDLALSLGEEPGSRELSPAVDAAVRRIAATAHAAGRFAGIFCADGAEAAVLIDAGYDLVTPGNDMAILRSAVQDRMAAARGGARAPGAGGY